MQPGGSAGLLRIDGEHVPAAIHSTESVESLPPACVMGRFPARPSHRDHLRGTQREYSGGRSVHSFREPGHPVEKGWSESGGEFRPNDFLHEFAISKAHRDRFAVFDFAGLDRGIALSLASGKPLSASQKKSRDVFNLRFGGVPKLLPQAMIFMKSNVLRSAFRFIGNRFQTTPSIFR